jgi:hypothetical protein
VAKEEMICPFSHRICAECALYRGRHYYLCFCREYRGYLGAAGDVAKSALQPAPGAGSDGTFEMPPVIRVRALDPFAAERDSHPREEG